MKILLVQTGFLGDTILSTPVIAAVKQLYPESRLYMLTTPAARDLVALDPLLEDCLVYDKHDQGRGLVGTFKLAQRLKAMQFDMAYSLHRSFRSAMLLWLSEIPMRVGFKDAALPLVYHQQRKRLVNGHDVLRNLSLMADDFRAQSPDTALRLFAPERDGLSAALRDALPPAGDYFRPKRNSIGAREAGKDGAPRKTTPGLPASPRPGVRAAASFQNTPQPVFPGQVLSKKPFKLRQLRFF